ncbi:hypothetical protein BC332_20085 [Capsicum chinense]|nr:hypothetical protein BC332_20085 [Capsicum chinense]
MQQLKVQPQLFRNLLQAETENNRDDFFIFRLNGKLLHFGKREFCVVTDLRFDKKSDFYSDFKAPNKLMSKYYPGIEKVKKSDFYIDFAVTVNFCKEDDLYEIDIVFTDEEMVKYNLLAIHQDSFVQQEQDNFVHPDVDGEKISSSNVKAEQIFDMKNELANVDKQFTEIKQYVVESVKTILNELRSAGIKSNEFNEDRNDSQSVDDLLQTPHGSKTCEEISNEPINMKDELSRDTTSKKDGNVTLT